MLGLHSQTQFKSRIGFAQSNHGLQLPDSNTVAIVIASFVVRSNFDIELPEELPSLRSHLRLDFPANRDILLQLFHVVRRRVSSLLHSVNTNDEFAQVLVSLSITLVAHHEEKVETRHDWS